MEKIKVTLTEAIRFEGVMRKPGDTVMLPPDHPLAKKPQRPTKPAKTAKRGK